MTTSNPGPGQTFDIASSTGWTFTATPFVVVVDRGRPAEEKILCSGIAGATITVEERGYDGTSPQNHDGPPSAAEVLHVLDSRTVDEANAHVENGHEEMFWMTVAP